MNKGDKVLYNGRIGEVLYFMADNEIGVIFHNGIEFIKADLLTITDKQANITK